MDNFVSFASESLSSLSNSVKELFTLPTIGLPTQVAANFTKVLTALSAVGFARGIPIHASSQQEIGQNNIGDQIMLRDSELGAQVITDNIAPLPREWKLQGYIQTPSFMSTGNYFLDTNNSILVAQAIKNYLRYLRTLRAPFRFITREGDVINVLMQNYTMTDEPESEWATKVELHLKEYIALGVNDNAYAIQNLPSLGGIFGKSAQYATAGTKVLNSALSLYYGSGR